MKHKGLVQIYTGNGKGKTTATLGLAMRAVGAGLKVYIMQFIKGREYSEIKAIKKIKKITVEQCGRGCFIKKRPLKKDRLLAQNGLKKVQKNIFSKKYDLVILDEVNVALELDLLKVNELVSIIKNKPRNIELVLTGRYCPKTMFKYVDLITEMKEVKHPYKRGIKARLGIEY